jgi:hypothetical protein
MTSPGASDGSRPVLSLRISGGCDHANRGMAQKAPANACSATVDAPVPPPPT